MTALDAKFFVDLIGKPYRENGRGPEEFDCAGLVVEMNRRMGYDFAIPGTPEAGDLRARAMLRGLREWWEVQTPAPGALVYFRNEQHVGIMIDAHRFIHVEEGGPGVAIESLSHLLWSSRPREFYQAFEVAP
jgi:cell wall-associated NlpC family hydrolase